MQTNARNTLSALPSPCASAPGSSLPVYAACVFCVCAQAPEVLLGEPYGCEVDVWSYGATLYELLHGVRPWKDISDANGRVDMARLADLTVSSKLSSECAAFLRATLAADWRRRIGCAPKNVDPDGSFNPAEQFVDWEEAKAHPWFSDVD